MLAHAMNHKNLKNSGPRQERGITIFVVAAVIVAVLGMAALAIDLIALYVAHGQAQRAADAAALAGAKMFVTSGFTSNPGVWTTSTLCQTSGPGAASAANQQAEAVAKANSIAGRLVTVQSITCPLNTLTNPTITVKVQQTGLPSYFAKVWGQTMNSVSATSTAEAYNPSTGGVPIQASIKPLLIPDCNPIGPPPPCAGPFFTDPAQADNYIGKSFTFSERGTGAAPVGTTYVIDLSPIQATVCPSIAALPANSCSLAGSGGVYDNMACGNINMVQCGNGNALKVLSPQPPANEVTQGTQCLIHTNSSYSLPASLCADADSDCFQPTPTPPPGASVAITGGQSNPNPGFRPSAGNFNISRSDSVVTVPIYNGATDLCNVSGCTANPITIRGFVQLGIQYVGTTPGQIQATVLNVTSCVGTGGSPVSGGGVSPVLVRLISQ
jgi:hypothetical protein